MAKSKHYLNNKDLLFEIIESKKVGELTNKAVKMLILLAERVVSRLPYSDSFLREEAESGAKLDLLLYWDRFDESKSNNAFAYFTQIAKNGAAKNFNINYQMGKKFKGRVISLDGSKSSTENDGIYTI